ncbi:RMD1 family protein [Thiomicrorhabdus sp. 6S2-11]|uniref:RMD1 family protein n=1 Tax=Thiomicrorhabdus marina TaxID=2818442 RepID=A0ABS3Q1T1_9GAMM|nr:RMD1 family protein [Thiomicrorhabdus marina]MBO1926063.1 RMD1 family protein [Thiomicrorhabdus marina]
MQNSNFISIYLPPDYSVQEISEQLTIPLRKGIEATHYAQLTDNRWLFFCQFDVLTFINWNRLQIIDALEKLGIDRAHHFTENLLHQDYQITHDAKLERAFKIDNDIIRLQEFNHSSLIIVALVLAQSVGLEHFEIEVERNYTKGRKLLEKSSRFSWIQRKQFSDYAKQISLLRHDMVLDLMLLDKPDVLWDNEDLERLYTQLSESLELKSRFDIISYKLDTLKDDIAMIMDLHHHKHSSFLEWIIILLILFEVIMGLGEHFNWF